MGIVALNHVIVEKAVVEKTESYFNQDNSYIETISKNLQKKLTHSKRSLLKINITLDPRLNKQQSRSLVDQISNHISNKRSIDYLPRIHLILCSTSAQSIDDIAEIKGVESIDLNQFAH